MTASTRMDKLFSALTAKERALAVLRVWKDGGEEDRQVRGTMPDAQVAEFNELIEIMNGVNERLGPYILLLRSTVEKLGLISGWLATIDLWGGQVVDLASFIFRLVPEPITESDYQRLKKRRSKPRPEWGLRFEPLPDSQAAEVKRIREERADVIKTVQKAPWGGLVDDSSDEKPAFGDRIRTALIDRLKDGWTDRYSEMLAIESFLIEAAEVFDGEDPAIPEVRAILDWMRPELIGLHEKLGTVYGEKFELPEPDDLMVEAIRRIARWPEQRTDLGDSELIRHITVNLSERDGDHSLETATNGGELALGSSASVPGSTQSRQQADV
jgi:hypothetical protein